MVEMFGILLLIYLLINCYGEIMKRYILANNISAPGILPKINENSILGGLMINLASGIMI